ncbi:MAG: prolyl oligopeptidase family serine peptidase [Bacteroidota bacterium]|nr:prolyl oligopeptidase family serine peptidase [Bacteroidota bacterium]
MKKKFLFFFSFLSVVAFAQKKPLDHSVYDAWQSIGERLISSDGKYLAYSVTPQEGDAVLYIQSTDGLYKKQIARGYAAVMTDDSRYLVCRIKPAFKDTRDARIKKKKADEMPKDSLVIVELGKENLTKVPRIKSFKVPDDSGNWLAYLLEKPLAEPAKKTEQDSLARLTTMLNMADSLARVADSIRNKANEAKLNGLSVLRGPRGSASAPKAPEEPFEEGTELVVRNLVTGEQKTYQLVSEYFFNKKGTVLVIETTRKTGDARSQAAVTRIDLASGNSATVFKRFNDAKGYRLDEDGTQLAFVAERDSSSKSLQKFYKLYYYKQGMDSAILLADRNSNGLAANWTVSENGAISFSKSGKRLFAGTAAILPVKDTSLPDFDRVSVDVWHYNDDYVQPVQLKNLENDLRKNYPARIDMESKQLVQLINEKFRGLLQTKEGDGDVFYASSDYGKKVASQWQGFVYNDIYRVNPETGASELIEKDFKGNLLQASYSGKYLLYYDERKAGYFVYNSDTRKTYPIAKDIKTSLSDEENDVPDDPNAYGVARWMEDEKHVLIYDRYDIWRVDIAGAEPSVCLTNGRKDKISYRYVSSDPDEKFLKADQKLLLRLFDEKDKSAGLGFLDLGKNNALSVLFKEPVSMGFAIQKAKNADVLLYSKETFTRSTNMYVHPVGSAAVQLSNTNPQQADYNWGTAELFKWKAYTGKEAEGILYKPEGFDPKKKYPMIVYFYERNNNTLHNYLAPAPTPSRLNIPFFVSRGYVVLVPDIWYKTGYPGQGAYDYIVSGTRAVVKQGYVDSTKIGLQGQSWGGYQIVYLITKTNLYAAAWAGAPVANMTSAYGGIRWGTGLLRQFQYEKTQSRIGGTLWEKPNLYLQNSALFSLPKVTTPLVIMHNDADDAVPWYQGIEMYAGMRRLGKKVWMLNYNGEAHNLIERKNRKDIQIREQQFFDYLLKGEKPAKWISEGVPAVLKGRDLGLGTN